MFLLDTTYILPFFQIQIDIKNLRDDLEFILKNNLQNIYISNISLIEAKWKSIREYQKSNDTVFIHRANRVIQSFYHSKYFTMIDPFLSIEILNLADDVLMQDHKDYMDCLILATAKHHSFNLVTEDDDFQEIIDNLGWTLTISKWTEFMKKIKSDQV